jgi:hypothetical protein
LKPIITLTSDFGIADPYVAAVKGTILNINPNATIVDLSHDITPYRVEQAAFTVSCALPYFPRGSIHVVVVDPEVGTHRRALALLTADGVFIGPDNGILSPALSDAEREGAFDRPSLVPLPAGKRAFLLANPRFQLSPPSATFHARDIFGPAAAYISVGAEPSDLGPRVQRIAALPPFRAVSAEDGNLVGQILHIDRFGNAITTIRGEQLSSPNVRTEISGRKIQGLCRTYADRRGVLALIGSSGFLEVAVNGGSAATTLSLKIGDVVSVRIV